ncbi:MAG: hypothetical protein IPN84_07610 [Sphingomonadales bacterium]|nr:hypothetical protein [Sphingomonadales bacterium]
MSRMNVLLGAALLGLAAPAQAQLFYKAPDVPGGVLTAPEKGYGYVLTGATPAENRAALVWNLRSALNVAALQCSLDPYLRIADNYNAMLSNHRDELAGAFTTLSAYFKRKNKSPKAAQTALDQYGTRTYSSFSAVGGLLPFCHVSSQTVRTAIFTKRNALYEIANARLRQIHNAVNFRKGEQQFTGIWIANNYHLPNLADQCWKKTKYTGKCG